MTITANAQDNNELALEALLSGLSNDNEDIVLVAEDETDMLADAGGGDDDVSALVMASAEPAAEIPDTALPESQASAPETETPEVVAKKAKAPKEPKEPKAAAAPRKHYANKVERITDKLGDDLGNYTVLEMADATLEGEALKAKQDETLAAIKDAGVKVQNRITFVLEYMAGKSAKLNDVIASAFKLLKSDGAISVGDEGNLISSLVASGKKPSSARAMGNNTIAALRTLKVISKDADGRYVPNAESLVLAKMNSMLT